MDVAVIGNLNYDIVLGVERLPSLHEKLRAQWRVDSAGGAPANVAFWLAALGFDVGLFSVVGADPFGQSAAAQMLSCGVRGEHILVDEAVSTGLAIAFSYEEQNNMITTGGTMSSEFWADLVGTVSRVPCRHIHVHPRLALQVREHLKSAGRGGSGPTISTDLNGSFSREVVNACDLIFSNYDELECALGGGGQVFRKVQSALEGTDTLAIVTNGARGSTLLTKSRVVRVRTVPVVPVDRTGGGDAFDAAVIGSWLRGSNIKKAMRQGHILASAVISEKSARPNGPKVQRAIAELLERKEVD